MISLIFLFVHITIVAVQYFSDRRINIFSPAFLFQLYFILQLPLNHYLGVNFNLPRFDAITLHFSAKDSFYLGSIILLSHVVFLVAYYAVSGLPFGKTTPRLRWNRNFVNYLAIAIIVLGYISFLGLMNYYGGYTAFQETRELWRTQGIGGMGWITFPATTGMSLGGCAILINNRDRFSGSTGVLKVVLLYLVTVLPATQLGFRSFVLLPALQMIFLYNFYIKKVSTRWAIAAGAFLMTVFTLYGMNRDIPYSETGLNPVSYVADVSEKRPELALSVFLRSMGADITQQTVDRMQSVIEYKKIVPIFVEAATIYVPAALWPDKPKPLSIQYSTEIIGISGGVSPTIVGEGYWHLGVLGIAILATFAGSLNGMFEKIRANAVHNDNSALMMASIYPQIIMMAEAFQGYFNGLILVIVFNLIFQRIVSLGSLGQSGATR